MSINASIALETKAPTFPKFVWNSLISAAAGALAGQVFHFVTPITGAIYGAAFVVPYTEFVNHFLGNDLVERIMKLVIQFFGQAALAFAVVKALAGYAITIQNSAILALLCTSVLIVTKVVINMLDNRK